MKKFFGGLVAGIISATTLQVLAGTLSNPVPSTGGYSVTDEDAMALSFARQTIKLGIAKDGDRVAVVTIRKQAGVLQCSAEGIVTVDADCTGLTPTQFDNYMAARQGNAVTILQLLGVYQ